MSEPRTVKGTPEIIRPLVERHLAEPHVRIAKKLEGLAHPDKEIIESLIDLLADYQTAAAWKEAAEGGKTGKNETTVPGNPVVAGAAADICHSIRRLEYRRKNNLKALRKDLKKLVGQGTAWLARYEARAE